MITFTCDWSVSLGITERCYTPGVLTTLLMSDKPTYPKRKEEGLLILRHCVRLCSAMGGQMRLTGRGVRMRC
jgi:hypothetical protein